MFVSGFTFIRNAVAFDFPVQEAIRSILPLCDEVVVAVGQSHDATLPLIKALGPRVRVIETVWDESLRTGGRVLAAETDKALAALSPQTDWAFYIQGDEVVHEADLPAIRQAMEAHLADDRVDGLLFDYLHFYGSYDYVGDSPRWYRREVRVVRPRPGVHSYRDAQGFRKDHDQKLRVKPANARIFHYGWVKPPQTMAAKLYATKKDFWSEDVPALAAGDFDYSGIDSLSRFTGTHPGVMQERIGQQHWSFSHDISYKKMSFRNRLKQAVFSLTGWLPGEYKNYQLR